MKQSDILRENADNCLRLAEGRSDEPSFKRFQRMAASWRALADEQDWLDGEIHPTQPRPYFRASPLNELARSKPSDVMSRYSTSA